MAAPTTTTDAPRRLLRPPAAARRLGLATSTLAKLRLRGGGPPYLRLSPGAVAYDLCELDAWIDAQPRHSSTSEYATP